MDENNSAASGNNNNDTVPMWLVILVFALLGIMIIGAFVFAGWSIFRVRDIGEGTVLALGKTMEYYVYEEDETPAYEEPIDEEPEDEYLDEEDEYLTEEEEEPEPEEPEEEPEPPAPVQAVAAPRVTRPAPAPTPEPTPAPEPIILSCRVCNGAGTVACNSCSGVGGGRAMLLEPGVPHEFAETGLQWWCTSCMAQTTSVCSACNGSGAFVVTPE
ncbi:MAG: hypothetical protein FWB96_01160 [Defluviitaleaceae bacterium]|nr:hypothetical protein [Defluviitaleaceae bacterium]MCL2263925.1 hypothetical protein [Defluviitaleaceae bacterium]